MDVKPGYTTTEWWTTLGAHVIALVALFHTATANSWAQAIVGAAVAIGPEVGAAVYAHSRSRLKAATSVNLAVQAAGDSSTADVATTTTAPPIQVLGTPGQPGVPAPLPTGAEAVPTPTAAPTS